MKPTIFEGDFIVVNKLAWDLKVPFRTEHISQWGDPQRGDIIVFKNPEGGDRLVKRVIGMPGDKLRIIGEQIWINDQLLSYYPLPKSRFPALNEQDKATHTVAAEQLPLPAVDDAAADSNQAPSATAVVHPVMFGPEKRLPPIQGDYSVPQGQYFMLGDHRNDSRDSRYFGAVDRSAMLGRVVSVGISLNPEQSWKPRWARFFMGLD
jgi:signal peptidase I